MFNFKNVVFLSMVLVESIPEHMRFKGNVTVGLPLEKAWKTLISMATEQVDLVSFYWTLTGEDISVNSSSDRPVSGPQTHNQSKETTMLTQASVKCVKVLNAACSGVHTFVSTRLCPLQGRDILTELGELPSRNICVRALASIPSVKANSTDLKFLKQKGLY